MPRSAAALLIGNELLSGKIRDTNLQALAARLRALGVQLCRAVTVLDDVDTIAAEVRALRASHDWLFTSGGVGPTHDDVTMAAVAAAFGQTVVSDPDLERIIRGHFGPRTSEGHLAMARIPAGAQLRYAPGLDWPAVTVDNVWVLPGLPEAFVEKLDVVALHLGASAPFLSRAVYTRLDEGTLKPHLDAVVALFPGVEIGSYPTWSDPSYHVKLTFDGTSPALLDEAVRAFVARLPEGAALRIE